MNWHDLLFMHWPVKAELLIPLMPAGLPVDLYDGTAWIGIVPFRMSGIRARYAFPIPLLSSTPEINVRTYVSRDGKPGVYFFSLDAASRIAVFMARRFFHLPYFHARMRSESQGIRVDYESRRRSVNHRADFAGSYAPTGPVYQSQPGSLEHWLTERYCLYTADTRGRICRGEIHHAPWPLQSAESEVRLNTMTRPLGFELPDTAPLLHFTRRLETVAWRLEPVG